MDKKLIVSPSPHVYSGESTRKIMRDILIALAPAFAVSWFFYGVSVLVVTAVSVMTCVLFEWLIQRFMLGGQNTIRDLSAVVTGVLLAFNLPSSVPLWMVAVGALAAIGIGKMAFGGLGRNPFNPALVGRVFLLLSFPVAMTSFPAPEAVADGFTGATPLMLAKEALMSGQPLSALMPEMSYGNLLLGANAGSIGEIAALALLLGFAYLLIRRVITWHIPVLILGTMAVFAGVLHGANPEIYASPLFHVLTGGAILGAVFMATDYSTSPMSTGGIIVYAVAIGAITMLIRVWGAYPEGISFAILIMNAMVPLLNKYMRPKKFGAIKRVA
ncbi:MAG: RnfABCDGE type electron transport complex subunit D [Rikenellaceae bacterium]|nr:RnfABCDGE type electron transport complex subunit D [Rikenellaceae bacterium]MCL2692242.1 RnfABCDGE type electron transport complex subunit D [Rikenellaceae bacterium]